MASGLSFGSNHLDTHCYAERDGGLYFDIYTPTGVNGPNKTVLYAFPGGFIEGDKRDPENVEFCSRLADSGFTVIAIDYRLGLKGVKNVRITNPRPAFAAVRMATEDMTEALAYTLSNSTSLGVDTSRIVLVGSSAGAVTVLQMDYELSNRTPMVSAIPPSFRPAGVVSMAGAVFSTHGMPRYNRPPAPTFFLHGTADKVVNYDRIKFFNIAMAGSNSLVKRFAKEGFPFVIYRYEGSAHEVADFPRSYAFDEILWFINDVALAKRDLQMDVTVRDAYVREHFVSNLANFKSLYK